MTLPEHEIARMLLALTLLVVTAHALGYVFGRLRQPPVIGEILGGLLLGPTLLGALAASTSQALFPKSGITAVVLAAMYQLGLLFLMFLAGSEIQARPPAGEHRTVAAVTATGLVLPLAAGLGVVTLLNPADFSGPRGTPTTFALVFGIAVAVTSIPVISRIMLDLGILRTAFARVVLSVAIVEDIVLYVVLAVVLGLAQAGSDDGYGLLALVPVDSVPFEATYHIVVVLLFFAVFLARGAQIFQWLAASRINAVERRSPTAFRVTFLLLLVMVCVLLGINPIFGALMAGVAAARGDALAARRAAAMGDKGLAAQAPAWSTLRQFSLGFFIPVYFAIVGLNLDLVRSFDIVFFLWFFVLACAVKWTSVWFGARLAGERNGRAIDLAFALNARGGPGIVLATVTLAAGIINEEFFTSLVLLSMLTSQVAGVWLHARFTGDREPDPARIPELSRP